MKYLIRVVAALIVSCVMASLCAAKGSEFIPLSKRDLGTVKTYQVNKRVKDFPEKEDLSTPELAYAAINRMMANGEEGGWRRVSCKAIRDRLPSADAPRKAVDSKYAEMVLNGKILDVQVWRDKLAQVCGEWVRDGKAQIDTRTLVLEDGKWLNKGNSGDEDLAGARRHFERICRAAIFETEIRPHRAKVADPEAYLRPYVDFLKKNAKEPREFVIDALKEHEIVILGEVHARQIQWQFAQSVVTHPDFARNVGVIYMEMPIDHQELVDKFLATPKCDPEPIIDTLRDFWEEGWPMQSWLDLFTTVWTVNQSLPEDQRVRIVFTDCRRPWKDIQQRSDWGKYEQESDRDPLMAQTILKDRREHQADKRNALFIVGCAHGSLNFEDMGGLPVKRAGWYLREALGSEVYSIIPHAPVIKSHGDISGRRCLALFDSAFAEVGSRPIAFPLAGSPFGEQIYDGDVMERISNRYCDGYSAYLYLGPPEYEICSSMIPTFYTSDFIQEMDRRLKLMKGKGWSEIHGKELTVENVIRQYGYWGKPEGWISKLGPIDAWKYGDDWESLMKKEKLEHAREHPEVIVEAAEGLIEAIRGIDYSQEWDGDWQNFPLGQYDYTVKQNAPGWISWLYKTFRDNPIQSVEVGKSLSWSQWGTPSVEYKITLKDGTPLEGKLPITYNAGSQKWCGLTGLDWHLRK